MRDRIKCDQIDSPLVKGRISLEPLEVAHTIVDLAADIMASDVLLLDISQVTIIADFFVIATGDTDRQRSAIAEHIIDQMRQEHEMRALAVEGVASSGWLLLDYGAVVVHIFSPEQRAHYRLEELWEQARTVVRIA